MGKVSDRIRELIERQVADRGLVVWYDPDKVYASLAKSLVVDDATVLVGDTGFFRLRERLEPLLEFVTPDGEVTPGCGVPPNVVVYVPLARSETDFALIEAETAGVVMEPGAEVAERNTRLQAIVEQVFSEIAPEKAAHVARQAEEGLLTLEELDRMADEAGAMTAGALKLIFGPISPAEVLLEFAASDKYDKKIAEKKAQGELVTLAGDELGLTGADTTALANFRKTLQRHLLLGELVQALPEPSRPGPLATFELPAKPVHQEAIRHLCRIWRNRVDLQEEYEDAADALEQAAGLAPLALPESAIAGLDTFAFIENRLLHAAVANLVTGDAEGVLALMAKRRESFWCRRRAEFPLVWSLVDAGAQLLAMGMNIRQALKKRKWTARELVEAYTQHTEPWMVLDRSARHLESRYARCEMSAAPNAPGLEQLMTHWRVNKKLTCRSTGTANLSEAKKKLATLELMEQAQSAGRLTEAFYRSLTAQEIIKVPFLKAVDTFLAQAPAGGTRVGYASTLRVLGGFLNANEQAPDVADISRATLQRHLDDHAVKTSVGTANHHRKVLNVFFNFCAAEYRITSPLRTVKKIEASTGALRAAVGTGRRPFTKDELLRAYAVANPFWRFAMMAAFYTGFRLGMITTLRWGNVDFDTWKFTIIDNKHRKAGQRTVPIVSPALRALLRSLRDATPDAAAGAYIFPAYATKYLSTPNRPDGNASELSREFHDAVLVGAGLVQKYEHRRQGHGHTCKRAVGELTFHSIKHNTVTTLKASGATEMAAREVVGHDSRQVSAIYTHASPEHMAAALRLLPEIFTT